MYSVTTGTERGPSLRRRSGWNSIILHQLKEPSR
jgi:hypothetical protein